MSKRRKHCLKSDSSDESNAETVETEMLANTRSNKDIGGTTVVAADIRKKEFIALLNSNVNKPIECYDFISAYKRLYDQWIVDANIEKNDNDRIIEILWTRINDNIRIYKTMHEPEKHPMLL